MDDVVTVGDRRVPDAKREVKNGALPLSGGERFSFIDALRGLAATGVLIHHALTQSPLQDTLIATLGNRLFVPLGYWGAYGVQVFFVISGFVIAHSLRDTVATPRAVGRFILRRQLRLDPPYWTALALAAIALTLSRKFQPAAHHEGNFSGAVVVANVFYLERFFGWRDVIGVGWTLCTEIQFYLAFIGLLWLATPRGRSNARGPSRAFIGLMFATAVACLAFDPTIGSEARHAGHTWPYFCIGVTVYWATRRQAPVWPALVLIAGLLGASRYFVGSVAPPVIVGAVTAVTVLVLGRSNRLGSVTLGPVVQYLGRISYSLYLVHYPLVVPLMRLGYKVTGERHGPALAWVGASLVLALVAADVFHRLIERPSVRLSARFKGERKVVAEPVTPAAVEVGAAPAMVAA